MGSKELPMQAIAPMALDHEKWEGKFTSLVPDEGWEQPDFDDKYWQLSEGAFGTPGMWEARTQWTSSNIWVRREVELIRIFWSIKRFICAILMTMYFNCTSMGSNW